MPPTLPAGAADCWERLETDARTLLDTPAARVTADTAVYEDGPLGRAVAEATGAGGPWRFVFATDVSFSPPLAAGVGSLVAPTVASEARAAFAADLEERGLCHVSKGATRRVDGDHGRARLTEYRAARRVEGRDTTLRFRGVLGVASADGGRVAGGVWPDEDLAGALGVDIAAETDPGVLGDEVRELVRRLL